MRRFVLPWTGRYGDDELRRSVALIEHLVSFDPERCPFVAAERFKQALVERILRGHDPDWWPSLAQCKQVRARCQDSAFCATHLRIAKTERLIVSDTFAWRRGTLEAWLWAEEQKRLRNARKHQLRKVFS